ncbi:MAG: sigma-70 family RNA polymerase sigma factor [Verrucomicrobiota bacterium]
MNDQTDAQLLHAYAEHRSESAFTALANRHVNFVYSAAVRMVCDAHLAQDVTQAAFVALAQNAGQLLERPVLSGWLHRTAQNIAAQTIRTEVRRRAREQEAAAMNEIFSNESDVAWKTIAPHLDDALGELSEPDRDALLLRYFERKSAREMAQTLNVSEEAAQKRVNRAVERLREFFTKRNINIGASGLVVLISANAVQAAPVGLAATIFSAATLAGTTFQTSTAIAATKTIAVTTMQKTLITTALVVVTGAGIYEASRSAKLQNQIQSLQQERASFTEQTKESQRAREDLANQLAAFQEENKSLRRNIAELPRLRGDVARLRKDSEDLARLKSQASENPMRASMESWLARVDQLKKRMQNSPDENIPELQFLTEDDWLSATRGDDLDTEENYRRAMSSLRGSAENKFGNMLQPALKKYLAANSNQWPTDLSQLQPYFKSPVDEAVLQRYKIFPAEELRNFHFDDNWIISQKAAIDEEYDSRMGLGSNGWGTSGGAWKPQTVALDSAIKILTPAMKDYKSANNGIEPSEPAQLLPYLKTPDEKAALQKVIQARNPKTD